jgi:hypothetical protein
MKGWELVTNLALRQAVWNSVFYFFILQSSLISLVCYLNK